VKLPTGTGNFLLKLVYPTSTPATLYKSDRVRENCLRLVVKGIESYEYSLSVAEIYLGVIRTPAGRPSQRERASMDESQRLLVGTSSRPAS
jgi:hypothetical protein